VPGQFGRGWPGKASAHELEALPRGGFCRLHAWRMAQLAGQRLAATYDALVSDAEEKVRRAVA